ncbi:retrovirus-related pol polyprotein from transposon TNT 1-94 [Tanacetum coccineum]
MLGKKPNKVYDPFLKAGLGYTNPESLKKAIAAQPKMYDGDLILSNKLVIHSTDSEETLEDAKESQNKMRHKMTLSEIKEELIEEVQEMLNIFDTMEQKVNEKSLTENILQNEIDRILEASLTSEIRNCVLLSVEQQKHELLKVELEKSASDLRDVQANLLKRIKILENDFQRSQAQSDKIMVWIVWIVDSGCSKRMTGNLQLLRNFIEKFIGTLRFRNDHFAAITGYGDYVQGNLTICHVYYVEGLGDNLFSVGQFCEGDLEMANSSPVCLMSRATSTKSWLWHRRLSHLNFGTTNQLTSHDLVNGLSKLKYHKNHLCSAYEQGKSKKASLPSKLVPSTKSKLELLHMDLCGPMRVASINGKKYILVIVDDYSRFTWVYFLRTKDEAPNMISDFVNQVQRNLKASILMIQTDNGTEFKNKKLRSFYAKLGIVHKTSIARTPQQNGIVERRNRTLVEAARTMLIFSKAPEFLWAEAIATACFTQNRSIVHTQYNKTPYELIRGRKPNVQYFHVFGSLCYPTNDRDDLGKMKPKADIGIFVDYSESSCGFHIYNRRTKKIMETIRVKFDELAAMASECNNLEPRMNCATFNNSVSLTFSEAGVLHVNWTSLRHCVSCRGHLCKLGIVCFFF